MENVLRQMLICARPYLGRPCVGVVRREAANAVRRIYKLNQNSEGWGVEGTAGRRESLRSGVGETKSLGPL